MKQIKWLIVMLVVYSTLCCGIQSYAQWQFLSMVDVTFCNDTIVTKELDVVTQAWKNLPICVQFVNKTHTTITINIDFLDSLITEDKVKNRACNAADRPKVQFGNFLLPYNHTVILKPNDTVQKQYDIKYPVWFKWFSHWCLAYNVIGTEIKDTMFDIVVRAVKYADIYVWEVVPVQTLHMTKSPKLQKIEDEYTATFWISNQGNVDEKVQIITTIFNIFWYQKEITTTIIIPASSWVLLTTPSFILPIYKWIFLIKTKIIYQPHFNFDITASKNPNKAYIWGTKTSVTLQYIWSWYSLLVIGSMVMIIYVLIKKKIYSRDDN